MRLSCIDLNSTSVSKKKVFYPVAPRSTRSAAENRIPGQSHSREVEVLARALAPGHKSHIDKDIPAKEFIRLLGYDVPDLTSDKNCKSLKIYFCLKPY